MLVYNKRTERFLKIKKGPDLFSNVAFYSQFNASPTLGG